MYFYKQYPQLKLEIFDKIKRIVFIFIGIMFLISLKSDVEGLSTLFSGEMNITTIQIVSLVFKITWIVVLFVAFSFVKKIIQKKMYLQKYGTKFDAKCEKIKNGFFKNEFHFSIQGQKFVIKEKKGSKSFKPLTKKKIREGDVISIIYNPENPADYQLDYEKFLNFKNLLAFKKLLTK